MTLRALSLWLFAFAVALVAGGARADVPKETGHVTDPTHTLSKGDKAHLDERLAKLQKEVFVDVGAWVVDAQDFAPGTGDEAFARWKVGHGVDYGILLIFPKGGALQVVQGPTPILTPSDLARLGHADHQEMPLGDRMDHVVDTVARLLRVSTLRVRPQGQNDPRRGSWFLAGAGAVLLLAIAFTVRERRGRKLVTG